MRKFYLTIACAALTVTTFAQKQIDASLIANDFVMVKAIDIPSDRIMLNNEAKGTKPAPRKTMANGVLYQVPTGSTWSSSYRPLYAGSRPYNYVAPLTRLKYNNKSTDKSGKWEIITPSKTIDVSDSIDENGDLWYYYNGGEGGYYSPTYTVGGKSFIPTGTGGSMITYITSLTHMTFFPSAINTNECPRAFFGGGSLSTGGLYGAGSINLDGVKETATGISYSIPKPMSPLYVEDIKAWGNVGARVTDEAQIKNPLAGKTLTLSIFNLDTKAEQPEVVLTCTPEDLVYDRDKYWTLVFTQKAEDPLTGGKNTRPFVIDYKAEIVIKGFEQDGVVLGVMGIDNSEEYLFDEKELRNSYIILSNPSEGKEKYYSYNGTLPFILFNAMFDKILVKENITDDNGNILGKANGVKISDDGATSVNSYYSDKTGALFDTAIDWFVYDDNDNATSEANYWCDDMADYKWIKKLTCTEVLDNDGDFECYQITPVCDALPKGVTKRWAAIHLNGRGYTSDPIFIYQGNITLEEVINQYNGGSVTSISSAVNDSKSCYTYNLNGQRVNPDTKGILINNGRKLINK